MKEGLHKWFDRNGGKGWADCKASKAAGKFVACGRSSAKKKSGKRGYPACRPTLAQCKGINPTRKTSTKRVNWKK